MADMESGLVGAVAGAVAARWPVVGLVVVVGLKAIPGQLRVWGGSVPGTCASRT